MFSRRGCWGIVGTSARSVPLDIAVCLSWNTLHFPSLNVTLLLLAMPLGTIASDALPLTFIVCVHFMLFSSPPYSCAEFPEGQIFIKMGKEREKLHYYTQLLRLLWLLHVLMQYICAPVVYKYRLKTLHDKTTFASKIRAWGFCGSSEYLSAQLLWRYLQISTHLASLIIIAVVFLSSVEFLPSQLFHILNNTQYYTFFFCSRAQ